MSDAGVRDVTPEDALSLVREGAVRVVDVRTPQEFTRIGHIPGARLIPVDDVAAAPAVLRTEDPRPILVCCEHGVRSAYAAALLARSGIGQVLNLLGGMSRWTGPRDHGPASPDGPSSWLPACRDLLPSSGRALDVACGSGRHALWLAARGLRVDALDRDAERIVFLSDVASRLKLEVSAEIRDLETGDADLGTAEYDVIAVVHYLYRPLFPALVRALRPGGLLLYETFLAGHTGKGPTNPAFLLDPGELRSLVAPLVVVRQREGEFEERLVAAVAARKSS